MKVLLPEMMKMLPSFSDRWPHAAGALPSDTLHCYCLEAIIERASLRTASTVFAHFNFDVQTLRVTFGLDYPAAGDSSRRVHFYNLTLPSTKGVWAETFGRPPFAGPRRNASLGFLEFMCEGLVPHIVVCQVYVHNFSLEAFIMID